MYENIIVFLIVAIFVSFILYRRNQENFDNEVKVILFYAPWCSYSQNFLTIWKQILKNKKNIKSNVHFIDVNIDINPEKAKLYNVRHIPIVFIEKNKEMKKIPKTELVSYTKLNNYIIQAL